jgi:hypothetical protein
MESVMVQGIGDQLSAQTTVRSHRYTTGMAYKCISSYRVNHHRYSIKYMGPIASLGGVSSGQTGPLGTGAGRR